MSHSKSMLICEIHLALGWASRCGCIISNQDRIAALVLMTDCWEPWRNGGVGLGRVGWESGGGGSQGAPFLSIPRVGASSTCPLHPGRRRSYGEEKALWKLYLSSSCLRMSVLLWTVVSWPNIHKQVPSLSLSFLYCFIWQSSEKHLFFFSCQFFFLNKRSRGGNKGWLSTECLSVTRTGHWESQVSFPGGT